LADQTVIIADPRTMTPSAAGEVGEIWVAGRSISQGYWKRPDETKGTFGTRLGSQGPFLRTGDLGFMQDGELFITGRIKDVIIVRGRNHYPQDIERTAEDSHPSLRRGCSAAFSIEVAGDEALIVAVEVERRYRGLSRSPSQAPTLEQRSIDPRGDTPSPERRKENADDVAHVTDGVPSLGPEVWMPFDPEAVMGAIREAILERH